MKKAAIIMAPFLVLACSSVGTPDYPPDLYSTPTERSPSHQGPIEASENEIYSNVCHLTIFRSAAGLFARAPKTGSAVLYRGEYLLTAAHNLYSPWYNPVERVEVRCGVTNAQGTRPDQIVRGARGATARGYRWGLFNADQFQSDFAVLHLNEPIATRARVSLAADSAPVGSPAELVGYPGGRISNAYLLYRGRAPVTSHDRNVISYDDIPTATGNSGGPVWRIVDDAPVLIGIHVTNSAARAVNASFSQEVDRMIAALADR